MRGQQERSCPLFTPSPRRSESPSPIPCLRCAGWRIRPLIPPEQLLLALLLQAIYGIRSERMLMEQLHCNLLIRWFIGLYPDEPRLASDDIHQESRPTAQREAHGSVPGALEGLA